jgi:hypothetical protein
MALIKNFTAPVVERANPYTAEVAALIAAGDGAASEISGNTPVAGEAHQRNTIDSEKRRFQDAARAAGYSAREVRGTRVDHAGGQTSLILILRPERKRATPAE